MKIEKTSNIIPNIPLFMLVDSEIQQSIEDFIFKNHQTKIGELLKTDVKYEMDLIRLICKSCEENDDNSLITLIHKNIDSICDSEIISINKAKANTLMPHLKIKYIPSIVRIKSNFNKCACDSLIEKATMLLMQNDEVDSAIAVGNKLIEYGNILKTDTNMNLIDISWENTYSKLKAAIKNAYKPIEIYEKGFKNELKKMESETLNNILNALLAYAAIQTFYNIYGKYKNEIPELEYKTLMSLVSDYIINHAKIDKTLICIKNEIRQINNLQKLTPNTKGDEYIYLKKCVSVLDNEYKSLRMKYRDTLDRNSYDLTILKDKRKSQDFMLNLNKCANEHLMLSNDILFLLIENDSQMFEFKYKVFDQLFDKIGMKLRYQNESAKLKFILSYLNLSNIFMHPQVEKTTDEMIEIAQERAIALYRENELSEIQKMITDLLVENHPEIQALNDKIDMAKDKLDSSLQAFRDKMRTDCVVKLAKKHNIKALKVKKNAKKFVAYTNPNMNKLMNTENKINECEKTIATLKTKMAEIPHNFAKEVVAAFKNKNFKDVEIPPIEIIEKMAKDKFSVLENCIKNNEHSKSNHEVINDINPFANIADNIIQLSIEDRLKKHNIDPEVLKNYTQQIEMKSIIKEYIPPILSKIPLFNLISLELQEVIKNSFLNASIPFDEKYEINAKDEKALLDLLIKVCQEEKFKSLRNKIVDFLDSESRIETSKTDSQFLNFSDLASMEFLSAPIIDKTLSSLRVKSSFTLSSSEYIEKEAHIVLKNAILNDTSFKKLLASAEDSNSPVIASYTRFTEYHTLNNLINNKTSLIQKHEKAFKEEVKLMSHYISILTMTVLKYNILCIAYQLFERYKTSTLLSYLKNEEFKFFIIDYVVIHFEMKKNIFKLKNQIAQMIDIRELIPALDEGNRILAKEYLDKNIQEMEGECVLLNKELNANIQALKNRYNIYVENDMDASLMLETFKSLDEECLNLYTSLWQLQDFYRDKENDFAFLVSKEIYQEIGMKSKYEIDHALQKFTLSPIKQTYMISDETLFRNVKYLLKAEYTPENILDPFSAMTKSGENHQIMRDRIKYFINSDGKDQLSRMLEEIKKETTSKNTQLTLKEGLSPHFNSMRLHNNISVDVTAETILEEQRKEGEKLFQKIKDRKAKGKKIPLDKALKSFHQLAEKTKKKLEEHSKEKEKIYSQEYADLLHKRVEEKLQAMREKNNKEDDKKDRNEIREATNHLDFSQEKAIQSVLDLIFDGKTTDEASLREKARLIINNITSCESNFHKKTDQH